MEMSLHLNYNEMTKRFNQQQERTIKCKCGHSIIFVSWKTRKLCRWCGNWVFKNKREEFKYRLMEGIHNANRTR